MAEAVAEVEVPVEADSRARAGVALWVSGDNLWKGAALNAIQNAEYMVREGLLRKRLAGREGPARNAYMYSLVR